MYIKSKYIDEEVEVKKFEYQENGRLGLRLQTPEGEPLITVSSNLGQFTIASDSIFVKNYSENEGLMDALIEAGVLGTPVEHVDNGLC